MALLEAVKISKSYAHQGGVTQALPEVSLSLDIGEFLVITGPSGAGKSTLLHLLSGLDRPSSGEILFKGYSYSSCDQRTMAGLRNSSFGFIFQTPHLLTDRTVLENIILPCHYSPTVSPGDAAARASELLYYIGMGELGDRYPATLSGGEMQRVVFARALCLQPEIIFADEPTGSLDAANSQRLLQLLAEQTGQGRTVVMVTHDTEAMSFGSRVIRLEK